MVFLYLWLPFMILPVQAALERVPVSLIEAAGDLGARPGQTFRTVILPLALPGVVAGGIFTFSLTLGDYIVPEIVGPSSLILGQVVYIQQGTAGTSRSPPPSPWFHRQSAWASLTAGETHRSLRCAMRPREPPREARGTA
jgi:ABC-type sulfate transport system permease component